MQYNPYQTPNAEVISDDVVRSPGLELAKRLAAFIVIVILFLVEGIILPKGVVVLTMIVGNLDAEQGRWWVAEFWSVYTLNCILIWLMYRNFRVLFGLPWAPMDGQQIKYYFPSKVFWMLFFGIPLAVFVYFFTTVLHA